MKIDFQQKGDFSKLTNFLEKTKEVFNVGILNKYGRAGVKALTDATPKDTGKTASSWEYKIENSNGKATLSFCNNNIQNGVPIAVIIQYGHLTGQGCWIEGIDYINPALKPVFDGIVNDIWKEIKRR